MRSAHPNRLLLNRKVQIDFSEPWRFAALRKAQSGDAERRSHEATSSENLTCLEWSGCWELNPVYVLPKHVYYRYTTARQFLTGQEGFMPPLHYSLDLYRNISIRSTYYVKPMKRNTGNINIVLPTRHSLYALFWPFFRIYQPLPQ